jgi:hypothetical protein
MPFIYSTLTAPQNYAVHAQKPDGSFAVARDIIINGGHGLTNIYGQILQGAETEIDNETLEILEKDYLFNLHKTNGFIKVESKSRNSEKAISDLAQRDKSAPATSQDVDALYDDGVIPVPVSEYVAEGKPRARNQAMQ